MNDKQTEIHSKGFAMSNLEFGKLKVNKKMIEDAVLDLSTLKSVNKTYGNKSVVLKALANRDVATLREISNYFYRTSGIYSRVCNYFAQMYRYDWYIVPEVYDEKAKEKAAAEFPKILNFLDNSYIKKTCMDIALQVIKNGAYYGCIIPNKQGIILQELPVAYCRCKYYKGHIPIVELNMKFFDEKFADLAYRMRILKTFPEDIQRGYALYRQNKLPPEFIGDTAGSWYVLDAGTAIKFDFGNGDVPVFASAIPALLDLDAAQELDRRKQMQKLLKIIVQKLPLDKNGDLIFDVDEAQDIHRNAVMMLSNAIGVDVLTTFADIESVDISDKATTTTNDELEKVERSLYNAFGTTQNIFNADGNLATTNSILNDEAMCRNLLLQFTQFYDYVTQMMSSNKKKWNFRLYMLETTQYNYKELSKMYKEQVQIGYSKMLPQIALGHSQSFIINSCTFENQALKLHEIMIPPLMSSTMSSEDVLGRIGKSETGKTQKAIEGEKSAGRKEKSDSEKSDKTIANRESMS